MKKQYLIIGAIAAVAVILIAVLLIFGNGGNKDANKIKLVKLYIDKGDYDNAQKLLEQVLIDNPNYKEAQSLMETVLSKKNDQNQSTLNSDKNSTTNQTTTTKNTVDTKDKPPVVIQETKVTVTPPPLNTNTTTNQTTNSSDPKKKQYDDLLAKGETEYTKTNYLKAIEYFNDAQKVKSDDYRVYQDLAKSYYAMNDDTEETTKKIISNAEKSIELKKDDVDSFILLGLVYYRSGVYEKSKEDFLKALTYSPDNKQAQEGLVLCYQALNDPENAKKTAENLLVKAPDNLVANEFLGKYWYAKENYQKAADYLSKVYAKDQTHKQTNVMLAKAYYMQKMYKQVVDVTTTSMKTPPIYIEEAMWAAMAYDKLGSSDLAIANFEKAIASDKFFDESYRYKALFNYGLVLKNAGNYQKAIDMFQRVTTLNTTYVPAYTEIGFAYFALKQYDDSITYYEKAIAMGEKSYSTYFNLGFSYYKAKTKGDLNKSLQSFNNALNENKNVADVEKRSDNYAVIYTIIGNMLVKDDKTKAYKYYSLAVKYSSIYIETYDGIFDCIINDKTLAPLDEVQKTIATGESRIKSSIETKTAGVNEMKRFCFKAGTVLFQYGDFENALKYAQKAIDRDKKYGDAYDLAIQTCIKLQKYKEALAYIDTYLSFVTDENKKNELIKLVDELQKKL